MYAKQSSVFKDLWNRQHNAKIGHIGATAKGTTAVYLPKN